MPNRFPPRILTLPLASETSYSESASGVFDGYNVDCTTVGNYTLTLQSPASRGRRFITQTGTTNTLTVTTAGTGATISGGASYPMSAGDGVEFVANGLSGTSADWRAVANNIAALDGVTPGQSAPSKALITDSAESLVWATTDATASETVTLSVADTRTGAGATGWAIKGDLLTNVALGAYANGIYGILEFTGSGGKVTGLAAGVASEIVMSAGCSAGTYAGLEVEFGMPTGALTGTASSFLYLSLYGAAAATFDTNGYLFQLAGVTKAGGKLLQDTTTGSTIRPVQVLKVLTPDGIRYLPLYSTAAIGA